MNYIGSSLITIGCIISGLGVLVTVIGHYYKIEVSRQVWENQAAIIHQRSDIDRLNYLFSTEERSKVTLEIFPREGPFGVFVAEFFGTPPEYAGDWWKSKAFLGIDSFPFEKGKQTFTLELNPGKYYLQFSRRTKVGVNAIFSLMYSFFEKPYEKYVDLGHTFLEVGIPILVTGFVIFSGVI